MREPPNHIRRYLAYDPVTGVFRSSVTEYGRVAGEPVGTIRSDGYVEVSFGEWRFLGHRLAWWWVHGVMPERLDHRDRNRAHNAIRNLRLATRTQNAANQARPRSRSPYKGVQFFKGRWNARIKDGPKRRHIGRFDTAEEAARAYDAAARAAWGDFAITNFEEVYPHAR